MIVYDAIGGGLGHAMRAKRVLAALQLEAWIISTADVPRELEQSVDHADHEAAIAEPYRLVVHSGPPDEVRELVAFAEERRALDGSSARIVVVTPCEMDGVERVDVDPSALFDRAERIVSAAGFNTLLETEPWCGKHDVVPFRRRFDDQFARAARRRRAQRQIEKTLAAQQTPMLDDRGGQAATAATTHHATS